MTKKTFLMVVVKQILLMNDKKVKIILTRWPIYGSIEAFIDVKRSFLDEFDTCLEKTTDNVR